MRRSNASITKPNPLRLPRRNRLRHPAPHSGAPVAMPHVLHAAPGARHAPAEPDGATARPRSHVGVPQPLAEVAGRVVFRTRQDRLNRRRRPDGDFRTRPPRRTGADIRLRLGPRRHLGLGLERRDGLLGVRHEGRIRIALDERSELGRVGRVLKASQACNKSHSIRPAAHQVRDIRSAEPRGKIPTDACLESRPV
jgi:hypothetical protein